VSASLYALLGGGIAVLLSNGLQFLIQRLLQARAESREWLVASRLVASLTDVRPELVEPLSARSEGPQ
jgi:hypothetical protein